MCYLSKDLLIMRLFALKFFLKFASQYCLTLTRKKQFKPSVLLSLCYSALPATGGPAPSATSPAAFAPPLGPMPTDLGH